jgi:selenocysteine lyase/cysteine desulfurase
VRAQFALSPDWVHMAGFHLASHPTRVREVIERYRRALDENPALCVEEHAYDPAPMLNPAATYLGVQPNEIALTDSTTMGLAMLSRDCRCGRETRCSPLSTITTPRTRSITR